MTPTSPQDPPRLGPLARALVRRFSGRDDDALDPGERRSTYGLVEGYVSVTVNLVLFAVKLILGLLSGSIALIADAVHTAADSMTSVVVILASYVARRPPDEEHPFGHGRSEAVAAVVIAMLLAVAGLEFGKESVRRILAPQPISAAWWVIGVVLLTAGVKEWLSRFALRLGRACGNPALVADAWHHRSDVFATLLVVVGMVGARFGLAWIDGAMGLGVSLLIGKVAYDVARKSIDTLLGAAPAPQEVERVKQVAMSMEGVQGVHDIVIHKYGFQCFISLHIETSYLETALELHQISHGVEKRLEGELAGAGHGSVNVHVDPINTDHPAYGAVEDALIELVEPDPEAESFHDLRLVGDADAYTILFELQMHPGVEHPEAAAQRIIRALRERFPRADVRCDVDPEFVY